MIFLFSEYRLKSAQNHTQIIIVIVQCVYNVLFFCQSFQRLIDFNVIYDDDNNYNNVHIILGNCAIFKRVVFVR